MADDEGKGERRRWLFIWIMSAFAFVSYGMQFVRPEVAPPVWVAPAMIAIVGFVVAEGAARRLQNGARKNGEGKP